MYSNAAYGTCSALSFVVLDPLRGFTKNLTDIDRSTMAAWGSVVEALSRTQSSLGLIGSVEASRFGQGVDEGDQEPEFAC